MWERFTIEARECLHGAQREAAEFGDEWVEPHHLLLGVFGGDKTPAVEALKDCGVELAEVRRAVGADPGLELPGDKITVNLGSEARAVCVRATADATSRQHRYIEGGHIALAL